jgi:GNAT superfamily N-acetyltransferase
VSDAVTLAAMATTIPPATVRRLLDTDHDRWQLLWAGYLAFYRADVPPEVTALTFERLRDGRDGLAALVAVDGDDQAIGFAHLVFHPSTWSDRGYCYLEDLYVEPAHRGAGVARALIEAVYALAAERGVQRVYWHTQQYNGPARSLSDTVGTPTSFVVYEHLEG